jgi:hypothetical protein
LDLCWINRPFSAFMLTTTHTFSVPTHIPVGHLSPPTASRTLRSFWSSSSYSCLLRIQGQEEMKNIHQKKNRDLTTSASESSGSRPPLPGQWWSYSRRDWGKSAGSCGTCTLSPRTPVKLSVRV